MKQFGRTGSHFQSKRPTPNAQRPTLNFRGSHHHSTDHQSRITFVGTNRFAALTRCAPTLRSFLAQMAGEPSGKVAGCKTAIRGVDFRPRPPYLTLRAEQHEPSA